MVVSLAQAGSAWKASLYNQVVIFVVMVCMSITSILLVVVVFMPLYICVYCQLSGEAAADWIKHAFIAKFNSLEPHVYADMERVLRKDIINLFNEDDDTEKVVFDHNYAITRRVGLSQVRLCVVVSMYYSCHYIPW